MNDIVTNFAADTELRDVVVRPAASQALLLPRARRKTLANRLLRLLFLGTPIALCLAYLWFNAADRYVATAEFIVEPALETLTATTPGVPPGPGTATPLPLGIGVANPIGAMLAYPVADYLQSSDALRALEKNIGYLDRMQGKTHDIFYRPEPWYITVRRYLGLQPFNDRRIPMEDLLSYYNDMVDVQYSLTENVVTVKVQAFTAEDAQVIASELLTLAEQFANEMNLRPRRKLVEFFSNESVQARERLKGAQDVLAAWQYAHDDFNPNEVTQMVTQVISGLEAQLAAARVSLSQTTAVSAGSPERKYYEHQVKTLTQQIQTEQRRLSQMHVAMSPEFYEYNRLADAVTAAQKDYLSTLGALQTARLQAAEQSVYVDKVYGPLRPQKAERPEWRFIIPIVGVVTLLLYGTLRIILALVGKPWRSAEIGRVRIGYVQPTGAPDRLASTQGTARAGTSTLAVQGTKPATQ